MTLGNEPACGMDAVYEQLDKLTERDLGCIVRFTFIPWGNEEEQIKRLTMTKEFDIYSGGIFTNLSELIADHAYYNIKDLLEKVPRLVDHYTVDNINLLESKAQDGAVYQIPSLSNTYTSAGFFYREDLRKKWGLNSINSFEEVQAYLYKTVEEFPDTAPIIDKRVGEVLWNCVYGSDTLWNNKFLYITKDEPYKIKLQYEDSRYEEMLRLIRKWREDGVISKDLISFKENSTMNTLEYLKAGKSILEFNNHFSGICANYVLILNQLYQDSKWGWFDYGIKNSAIYKNRITTDTKSLLIGLGCRNPELALKFIEKAHISQEYYDLLMYGVEGIHYNLTLDGKIHYEGIKAENKLRGWTGLDDCYLDREILYPETWADVYREVMSRYNEIASENGVNLLEGFNPDISGIYEISNEMNSIYDEYILPLTVGLSETPGKDLERVVRLLEKAGIQQYRDMVQEQLEEYYKKQTENNHQIIKE